MRFNGFNGRMDEADLRVWVGAQVWRTGLLEGLECVTQNLKNRKVVNYEVKCFSHPELLLVPG